MSAERDYVHANLPELAATCSRGPGEDDPMFHSADCNAETSWLRGSRALHRKVFELGRMVGRAEAFAQADKEQF